MTQTTNNLVAYIWSLADILSGDFKRSHCGRIILPFTLLRRLEGVLEESKEAVLAEYKKVQKMDLPEEAQEKLLLGATSGLSFFNISKVDLSKLGEADIKANLESYIQGFSKDVRDIFEQFMFIETISQLNNDNLLYEIVQKFRNTDLSQEAITNHEMSLVFEELIRRVSEDTNGAAGEHFTPRDIVRLVASLVFDYDSTTTKPEACCTIYDPAVGTGGFLSEGIECIKQRYPLIDVQGYGEELNAETYAICKAGMLIKGHSINNIKLGNTLSEDQFYKVNFDYMLSHPPFGVAWKNIEQDIKDESTHKGFDGRFGPGLPRVSDGSLLFLLHLISKLRKPNEGGGRIGIIINGSALVTGSAGSGESEIRRYVLESDLLEAIIALPPDMFYNTGIATYVWVLSNKKDKKRKSKIQVIDSIIQIPSSTSLYGKMKKSLGSKRNLMSDEDIVTISHCFSKFEVDEACSSMIYDTKEFGYRRITIERPLRLRFIVDADRLNKYKNTKGMKYYDEFVAIQNKDSFDSLISLLTAAKIKKIRKTTQKAIIDCFGDKHPQAKKLEDYDGIVMPDIDLRKYENVPLDKDVYDYFESEILPYIEDAWIDENVCDKKDGKVGIVGYEININRIRLNNQMERLETQYSNYIVTNLGRLALEFNYVNSTGQFEDYENVIYIHTMGNPKVLVNLNSVQDNYKNYVQVVLNTQAINEYIVSFFKSALGGMALQAAMSGNTIPSLRMDELDKITIALPDLAEQENIVSTLLKLATLKEAIDDFDSELALNPTSSKSILSQLDDMLDTIGGLTEADEIRGIVREGESEKIEFKSTLSLDLKTNKKEAHIETSAFKTVVAFLNSNGGTLLIGIADDGETLGLQLELEKFYKGNLDKYLLHWKNKLKSRIGEQYYPFIKAKIVTLGETQVLKIDCQQALTPCYLDNRDFYVRTNPATDKLEGPKLVEYVNNHFTT